MSPQDLKKTHNQVLSTIVGAHLNSVLFALDYLILGFDENDTLTTLVWPLVTATGKTLAFGTAGYRDRLCELIGRTVKSALIDDEEAISIFFASGQDLFIPLRTYSGQGQRATLTSPNHSPLLF